jgi:hypothetical protein
MRVGTRDSTLTANAKRNKQHRVIAVRGTRITQDDSGKTEQRGVDDVDGK